MAEEKKVKRLKKERGKETREGEGSEDDLAVEEGKRAVTYQVSTQEYRSLRKCCGIISSFSVFRFLVTEV